MSESEEFCVQEQDDVQIAVVRRKQLRLCQITPYNVNRRNKHGKNVFDKLSLIEKELTLYKKKVKLEADFSSCITNHQLDNLKNVCHKDVVGISEEVFKLLETDHLANLKKVLEENSAFERYEASLRLNFALEEQDNFYRLRIKALADRFNEKFRTDRLKLETYFQFQCNTILEQVIADCDEKINQVRLFLDAKGERLEKSTEFEAQPGFEEFEIDFVDIETQHDGADERLDLKKLQSKIIDPSELVDFTYSLCDYNVTNERFLHKMKESYLNNLANLKSYFLDWYDKRPENKCKCDWSASEFKINCLFSDVIKTISSMNIINQQNTMTDFIRSPALVVPKEVTEKLFCACESASGFSHEEEDLVESSDVIICNELSSSLSTESYSSSTLSSTEPKPEVSEVSSSKLFVSDPEALNQLKCKLKYYLVKIQDYIMECFNTRFLINEILEKKLFIKNSTAYEIEKCLICAVKEKVHEIVNQFCKDSAVIQNASDIKQLCLWQPSETDNIESVDSKVEQLPIKIVPKDFKFREVTKDEFTRILLYPHCIISSESESVHL